MSDPVSGSNLSFYTVLASGLASLGGFGLFLGGMRKQIANKQDSAVCVERHKHDEDLKRDLKAALNSLARIEGKLETKGD